MRKYCILIEIIASQVVLRIPERYLAAKYHNSVESNLLLIRKRSNLEYVIMTPKPV